MAYWGEALSFSQPLWFFEEVPQARAALAKLGPTPEARLAKARTPREQGFLRAVEALFGAGDTAARAAAYAQAMAKVAADHPEDDEAQTFYALALLGTLPRGDASLPLRRQAGAIAEKVFARSPNHPGAAHYILHAYDHVTLAPKGLAAARAVREDCAGREPRPAHARARLFATWLVGRGGRQRSSLVGRVGRLGEKARLADRQPRFSQPDVAAVRMDAAGPLLEDQRSARVCG